MIGKDVTEQRNHMPWSSNMIQKHNPANLATVPRATIQVYTVVTWPSPTQIWTWPSIWFCRHICCQLPHSLFWLGASYCIWMHLHFIGSFFISLRVTSSSLGYLCLEETQLYDSNSPASPLLQTIRTLTNGNKIDILTQGCSFASVPITSPEWSIWQHSCEFSAMSQFQASFLHANHCQSFPPSFSHPWWA